MNLGTGSLLPGVPAVIVDSFKKMGKDKISMPRPAMTIVGDFVLVGTVIMKDPDAEE